MSYDYRFQPPTINELDEMAQFEADCDHNCDECCFDCDEVPV